MSEQIPGNDRQIPERKSVKDALRNLGMSARQVDALIRNGWAALVGETIAENDELREAVAELTKRIRT